MWSPNHKSDPTSSPYLPRSASATIPHPPPHPVSIFKYPFPILRRCPTYTPFRSSVRSRRCPVRNAVCLGLPVHLLQFIDRGSKLRFLRWLRRFSKCNNNVFINRQTQFTITISTGLWQMRHAIGDEQSLPRRPSPPPLPYSFNRKICETNKKKKQLKLTIEISHLFQRGQSSLLLNKGVSKERL